jgi:hypothetical protein
LDVNGGIVGRPVNAVLVPAQAERFALLAGVNLGRLVLNVTGWNKLVLLDSDRAFLFPRSVDGAEWFERELAAYRALAATRLSVVPGLLGRWEDPEVYPFPFTAVTRLRGEIPAEPEALIEQMGRAIACWNELDPPTLAGARPPRHHAAAHHRWLRRLSTRAPAPRRQLRPPPAWAGPAAPRPGQTCWQAPPSMRRSCAWRHPRGPAACRRGSTDRHYRLGDGPGRSPVLGLRPRRVGYRAVAPPPRLQRPVGAGVARVRSGTGGWIPTPARWRPLSGSGTRCPSSPTPGDPVVVGTLEEHLADL